MKTANKRPGDSRMSRVAGSSRGPLPLPRIYLEFEASPSSQGLVAPKPRTLTSVPTQQWFYHRRTPHPVKVTIRDTSNYIGGPPIFLLYHYYRVGVHLSSIIGVALRAQCFHIIPILQLFLRGGMGALSNLNPLPGLGNWGVGLATHHVLGLISPQSPQCGRSTAASS